jgi:hypothetical protein
MTEDDTLARNRFFALNAIRLGGLAVILVAIAIHYGKIEVPQVLAYILAPIGLFEFFFLPNIVARKWRTPDR